MDLLGWVGISGVVYGGRDIGAVFMVLTLVSGVREFLGFGG